MKKTMLLVLSLCLLAGLAHADLVRDGRVFAGAEFLGPATGPIAANLK